MKGTTKPATIECVVGLQNALRKTDKRTLLVIDEADYCLLDCGKVELPKDTKVKAIVAVSASLPESD